MSAAAQTAALTQLGRALGCVPTEFAFGRHDATCGKLPAVLYYSGGDLFVGSEPRPPLDGTRPPTRMDREQRELALRGRADLVRFFGGRWSRRLGRVVRPI